MEALQWHPDNGITFLTMPALKKPSCPNKVIVKVAYAGVCGTDLLVMKGLHDANQTGVILGHETSGVVKAVGEAVTSFNIGDHVVVKPNSHCGKCHFCLRGKVNLCAEGGLNSTLGIGKNGGWTEFCEVPDNQVNFII